MHNKKICMARIVKNIEYFFVPIFLAIFILCILSLITVEQNVKLKHTNNYYESSIFTNEYLKNLWLNNHDVRTYELSKNQYGNSENIVYNWDRNSNIIYLIINKKTGTAYTSVQKTTYTDTIDEIKTYIGKNEIHWNYVNEKIDTSAEALKEENIYYDSNFETIKYNKENVDIYSAIIDDMPYNDSIVFTKIAFQVCKYFYNYSIILLPLSMIALIIAIIAIINGIGKTAKYEEIHLTWFDKWKLEIVTFIILSIIMLSTMAVIMCFDVLDSILRWPIGIIGIITSLIFIYLMLILLLETIVKRIKTHTIIKSSLIYAIFHQIAELVRNRKITTKLVLFYGSFCLAGFICTLGIMNSYSSKSAFFWVIMLIILAITTFYLLFKKLKEFEKVKEALKNIYEGNTEVYINPNELNGDVKKMAIYIDDIAGGLSNAIQESLKSERLKTELITNVSHDIKTPLTSIINYVDLLKKEKMPNEKAQEYLMVLENKSQRLKKLTEDLVEASKASSGNIKLNMEKLNVIELVKQVSGEFEDKFKESKLTEIMTVPEEAVYIEADGRYMYRILENIYANTAKYAMENTRVYVDVKKAKENVVINMKNVSKDKLNISADELMQRFVRGEASRNTEGSGLGLSIATSLTELQGGKFQIYLDGDLFKVTIEFKIKD